MLPLDVENPSGAVQEFARHGSHLSGSVSLFILSFEWLGESADHGLAASGFGAVREAPGR